MTAQSRGTPVQTLTWAEAHEIRLALKTALDVAKDGHVLGEMTSALLIDALAILEPTLADNER